MSAPHAAMLILSLLALTSAQEFTSRKRHEVRGYSPLTHPFQAFEQQLSHYLFPWKHLFDAAISLDVEDKLEEPSIVSDNSKFEVIMNVKSFQPEEIRVKVKNRHLVVEGKHKITNEDNQRFVSNHFVQRFVLPAGTKQEEVVATIKENGVLNIIVPKHEVPPPPPEREVPIVVLLPETTTLKELTSTEKEAEISTVEDESLKEIEPLKEIESFKEVKPLNEIKPSTEEKPSKKEKPSNKVELVDTVVTSTSAPLEQFDESTAHVGKIRKKELKVVAKTTKDNEVTKEVYDNVGWDNALVE